MGRRQACAFLLAVLALALSCHESFARPCRTSQLASVASRMTSRNSSEMFYEKFHNYDDLVGRWKWLNSTYSSLRLSVIGETFEKRPIYAMTIGKTNASSPVRALFSGMQHGNEWITTMVATYAAEKFAAAAVNRTAPLFAVLKSVEVIVLPMVNPDGFVHSFTSGRPWRKNRQKELCRFKDVVEPHAGVDLNRNWGSDFGGAEATSTDPCSENYIGDQAFSAAETAAVRRLVERTPGIRTHVDIHSYANLVIGPWMHTKETPKRAIEIDWLGNALARNLSTAGKRFKYGRGANNNKGLASGTMQDWFFARNVLSFSIELLPIQKTFSGTVLDTDRILPNSKKVFIALSTLVKYSNDPGLELIQGKSERISRVAVIAIVAVMLGIIGLASMSFMRDSFGK